MNNFQVGDKVKYNDINLHDVATVEKIGKFPLGGDCLVRWNRYPQFASEECSFNLKTCNS